MEPDEIGARRQRCKMKSIGRRKVFTSTRADLQKGAHQLAQIILPPLLLASLLLQIVHSSPFVASDPHRHNSSTHQHSSIEHQVSSDKQQASSDRLSSYSHYLPPTNFSSPRESQNSSHFKQLLVENSDQLAANQPEPLHGPKLVTVFPGTTWLDESPETVVEMAPDQLEGQSSSAEQDNRLAGADLLALESLDRPSGGQSAATGQPPPYALNASASLASNFSLLAGRDKDSPLGQEVVAKNGDQPRLIKLFRVPPSPIYIRHSIPIGNNAALANNKESPLLNGGPQTPLEHPNNRWPIFSAFPHPSSSSSNQQNQQHQQNSSTGGPQGQRNKQDMTRNKLDSGGEPDSFALVPSWPHVFIAQRESRREEKRGPLGEAVQQQVQAPSAEPSWSTQQRPSAEGGATSAREELELESRRPTGGGRSTASSVEYAEGREREQDDELAAWDRQKLLERLKQKQADFWAAELAGRNRKQEQQFVKKEEKVAGVQRGELEASRRQFESVLVTNRTIVSLHCEPAAMLVKLRFRLPFFGSIHTDPSERDEPPNELRRPNSSASTSVQNYLSHFGRRHCSLSGNGSQLYELRLGLDGESCGTKEEAPLIFVNHIRIRFNTQDFTQHNSTGRAPFSPPRLLANRDDQDDEHQELKSIICSYPRNSPSSPNSPNSPLTSPAGPTHGDQSGSLWTTQDAGQGPDDQTRGREPQRPGAPERIIEDSTLDTPPTASGSTRDFSGAIVLLVAGLLLSVFAIIALTTSALFFAMRRRSSELAPRRAGPPESHTKSSSSAAKRRRHNLSPAQISNSRASGPLAGELGGPVLVAPPLISAQPSGQSSGSKIVARKYADERPAGKQRQNLDVKALHLEQSRKSRDGPKRVSSAKSPAPYGSLLPKTVGRRTGDSLDSSRSSKSDDQRSTSVTTIEIPFVGQQTGEKKIETFTQTLNQDYERKFVVEKTFTNVERKEQDEENGGEQSLGQRQKQVNDTLGKSGQREQRQDKKDQDNLIPFGSFRSKLTSPMEYRRLQNISKIFSEINQPNYGKQSGADPLKLQLRPSKYSQRILVTMNETERRLMGDLLHKDEVFRSYVVECFDSGEKFDRKLRLNRNYADKFSPSSWNLFKEILSDKSLIRDIHSTEGHSTAMEERHRTASKEKLNQSSQKGGRLVPIEVQRDTKSDLRRSDSLELEEARRDNPRRLKVSSKTTEPVVRVSHYNSAQTKHDGGTSINIDSKTNISHHRLPSDGLETKTTYSYTRSSFEQKTSYLEERLSGESLANSSDDEIQFMDDNRTTVETSQNEDSSSLSSRRQADPAKRRTHLRELKKY